MTTTETHTPVGFTADAKVLRDAIARIGNALPTRNSVPILGGIRIESGYDGSDGIYVTATDMSLSLREHVPAWEVSPGLGIVAMDAKKLAKGLATFDGPLAFSSEDADCLAIRNGVTTIRNRLGPIEDFPVVAFSQADEIAVDREAFLSAFSVVSMAASRDESRPVLTGIRIEPDTDAPALRLVATDSYRLACATVPCEDAARFVPMTVQAKDLTKVAKLAAKGEGPLRFAQETEPTPTEEVRAVNLYVRDGERCARLRRIDGQYPNWRQLVTDGFPTRNVLDRAALAKALARMEKLSPLRNQPVRIEMAGPEMRFSMHDGELRRDGIETVLPADIREPFGQAVGANPGFLHEAVSAIDGDEIALHFISPLRPLLVTSTAWNGYGYADHFHLVMPIRLAA